MEFLQLATVNGPSLWTGMPDEDSTKVPSREEGMATADFGYEGRIVEDFLHNRSNE